MSVRSGGHSWAAWSPHDDALLIDLGALRDPTYDASTGVVTAGPATAGAPELEPFLTTRGRAFPLGWACESIVAQTYPNPALMWQDTWSFHLDDAERVVHWLHEVLPGLDRRVEPVLAATRLPDVPLHDGVEHPGGTVLLLHTTCMADSEEEARQLIAALGACPVLGRELGHVSGPTSVAAQTPAQVEQNPKAQRYAVDCAWSDAGPDVLAPLLLDIWRGLDTPHSFSIWYGGAPRRPLPDMAFSVGGNVYVATYLIYTDEADDERCRSQVHERTAAIASDGGVGVYLGDTDFTRRTDRFLSDDHFDRLARIRGDRDPDGLFASYLVSDASHLNRHG